MDMIKYEEENKGGERKMEKERKNQLDLALETYFHSGKGLIATSLLISSNYYNELIYGNLW